jgi:hypothetical protein
MMTISQERRMPILISIVILLFWGIGMFFILKDEIKKSHMIEIRVHDEAYFTNKVDTLSPNITIIDDHGRRVKIRGTYSIIFPK